jgi:hypothetical protein
LKSSADVFGAKLTDVIMAGNYWVSATARDQLRIARARYYGKTVPAATGVFFTGFAAKGDTAALELVVAAPDAITLAVGSSLMNGTRLYKSHLATMTQSVSTDGVNAVDLHGGEVFRIPTFDLLTRKTEWHNYRVAGRDTVLVKKRKVSAWIIEEENQPRYKLRKIWLIQEPPFLNVSASPPLKSDIIRT